MAQALTWLRTNMPGRSSESEVLGDIRTRLVDGTAVAVAVLGTPAIAASLARTTILGWQSVFYVQIAVLLLAWAVALLRHRLPYTVKALLIPGYLFVAGLAGVLSFGLLSYEVGLFSLASILVTAFFGLRAGVVALLFVGLVSALVVVVWTHGLVSYGFDMPAYAVHRIPWWLTVIALITLTGVMVVILGTLQGALYGLVASLSERKSQVEKANAALAESVAELKRVEEEKAQFYNGTISSVTQGKLEIAEADETAHYGSLSGFRAEIHSYEDTSIVRHGVKDYFQGHGFTDEELSLFQIAVGEAMTNAVKHARGGEVFAGVAGKGIWVGISDKGSGIPAIRLPQATLRKGYSTRVSMGMGYTMMLDVCDQVVLNTGPDGTTVVLKKDMKEAKREPSLEDLADTWDEIP